MSDKATITEIKTELDTVEEKTSDKLLKRSIKYYEEAAALAKEIMDKQAEARIYSKLGEAFHKLGDINISVKNYKSSSKIYENLDDKNNELTVLMKLGEVQRLIGKFEVSIESFQRAATLANQSGNLIAEEECFGLLGVVLLGQLESKKAFSWFEKALKLSQKLKNKSNESKWLNFQGQCYHNSNESKDYSRAISCYERAIKLAQESFDKRMEGMSYAYLGRLYFKEDELKKAIENLEKSVEIIESIKFKVF
jgi:tetratricopeptide (TPR) repeat protein